MCDKNNITSERPVFEEHHASIGFSPVFERLAISPEEDCSYADLGFRPWFTHCSEGIKRDIIVWDVRALVCSCQNVGGYFLITCSCGYVDDVGIKDLIYVSHPDDKTIVWEFDAASYFFLLENVPDTKGFVRLHFQRATYQNTIREMLHAALSMRRTPLRYREFIPLLYRENKASLDSVASYEDKILVEDIFPDNEDIEEFCAELLASDWQSVPSFPPGTEISFKYRDGLDYYIDGKRQHMSMVLKITRWAVSEACSQWLNTFEEASKDCRTSAKLREKFIQQGGTEEKSHRLGICFAKLWEQSLLENYGIHDVRVHYVETQFIMTG